MEKVQKSTAVGNSVALLQQPALDYEFNSIQTNQSQCIFLQDSWSCRFTPSVSPELLHHLMYIQLFGTS